MQNIGKFQVVGKLGEGGMGVVYKAFDPLMQRHVAIKTISQEVSGDARSRERFLREARAIARLDQHKNIVTVHELFEEAGQTYLVMELLVGATLEQVIKSPKRLSLEEKLRILIEVCDGLQYAHDNGIIHRDVKPGNTFLGKNRSVKILDFGLAHIAVGATQTLRNVGTPCYMSPEQWKGEEADARTDIFSLGVVAYELLTGERPFYSESLAAIGLQVLSETPKSLNQLNPAMPPALSEAIARALSKRREERYDDAREMGRELERIRGQVQDAAQGLLALACKTVDDFDGLVSSRRALFRSGLLESVMSAEGTSAADAGLLERIRGGNQQTITNARQTVEYLELLDEVGQFQSQLGRAQEILPRLERASSLLRCAEVEEAEGNLEGALRMASTVFSELPSWKEVAELVERVRVRLESETVVRDTGPHAASDREQMRPVTDVADVSPVRERPENGVLALDSEGLDDSGGGFGGERVVSSTASPTWPDEERRERIASLLEVAASLLGAQQEKELTQSTIGGATRTTDGTIALSAPLPWDGSSASNVEALEERKRRIAALLAEARAQMEAQSRIRALDLGEEPEEVFVFKTGAYAPLTSSPRGATESAEQREATIRLKRAAAETPSWARVLKTTLVWLLRARNFLARLFLLTVALGDSGWKR